ncbi:MAG: CBS domain-containing protein [Candidatus Methanomethylophilaceae archaeon]|nr:CBS domain-containing protein [Candidatus Methanomethylophilaceae archaeon]
MMTSMPIVATVPGSRNDAINLMVRNKLTGVPVVRESDGQLMGIVSRRDVFNNMNEEQLSMLMKKNPITITPDKPISEAAKIFYDLRIHRLPVVEKGRLVGIVTPTDLLREIRTMKTKKTAIDSIRAACVTCYKDDPLSYVVAAMKISSVTAMPVLDERGVIIGLITDRDLFNDQTMDVDDMKKMGLDDTCSSLAGYRNVLPLFCVATKDDISDVGEVSKYMVKSPTTVYKKTTLNEVAKLMYHNDFGQIPIHGDKDELIGMIYDVDVLAALLEEN